MGHLGYEVLRLMTCASTVLLDVQTSKVEQLQPTAAEKSKYILEE